MRAVIYGLYIGDDCFYVGSTKLDPQDRLKHHLWEAGRGTHPNENLTKIVNRFGDNAVSIRVLRTVPLEDRWEAEREMVKSVASSGEPLVNKVYGSAIEFSIHEYWLDYSQGVTDEQMDYLFANPKPGRAADPFYQDILEKLHSVIVLTIKTLVETHRPDVERDCPRMIEWYDLHIENG